ncbi:MAG: S-adenosylmethionine decarboxylase [SAR324 cluster bacterium]|nr:S-adenosylmethionine decarboxylase [SAR324 cluster bacterium]
MNFKNGNILERNHEETYGLELILDLKNCNKNQFSRREIDHFFSKLCELIKMEKCVVHFWDDVGVPPEEQQTDPHTKGTSAVCFILTSTITIHTLDLLGKVYVNIFSCKEFDPKAAEEFTREWFEGEVSKSTFIERV